MWQNVIILSFYGLEPPNNINGRLKKPDKRSSSSRNYNGQKLEQPLSNELKEAHEGHCTV